MAQSQQPGHCDETPKRGMCDLERNSTRTIYISSTPAGTCKSFHNIYDFHRCSFPDMVQCHISIKLQNYPKPK
ncbi:hypothetical protein CRENBAI_008491 [Crenichthys baileyi]|uniref:Uncharacterized protein n=1 Tax=Crenichthys baileyi TaxID=28760 RepID=A0AAV9SCT1_9TELE